VPGFVALKSEFRQGRHMEYHTYTSIRVHIIFGTDNLIRDDIRSQLWAYMAGVARNIGAVLYAVNGARDHAHVFVGVPANVTVSEIVQKLKANTSRWLHEQCEMTSFAWQEGFGAFSVSISHTNRTIAYIKNQPQHHNRCGYGEELARILSRHKLS
jgi:putative transposase